MNPLARSIFIALSVGLIVGGTLILRGASEVSAATQPAHLTPAQLAEMAPAKPAHPVATKPVNDASTLPPPPEDGEAEDGDGS
jgi:hypothetical protein